MQITQERFSEQERKFFSRVATKMVSGADMEQAMRAVMDEDRAACSKVQSLRPYDKADFAHKMARQVFAVVHMRSALEQA